MKLVDLLVQELPKRGGWPEGCAFAVQDHDGDVKFVVGRLPTLDYRGVWIGGGCGHRKTIIKLMDNISEDYKTAIVSRKYYEAVMVTSSHEAALAASKTPVWDGKGLPPVGCEFEYGTHRTKAKCLGIGHHMVFASKGNPDDEDGEFEEFMISILDSEFHVVRTESERKREDIGLAIYHAINWNSEGVLPGPARMEDYRKAYDAIAAGKIPGVKLDE